MASVECGSLWGGGSGEWPAGSPLLDVPDRTATIAPMELVAPCSRFAPVPA